MDVKVYPGILKGTVQAPPSKSLAHRALICAALSDGECLIHGISGSKDMDATIGCVEALGAKAVRKGTDAVITGIFANNTDTNAIAADASAGNALLDCNESGSTLRFMLPVAAALGATADFVGRGKLPERPNTPLADEMKKKGITFAPDGKDNLPFTISGQLEAGTFTIPGNVSSQYISGLIFALPLLEGDSRIEIVGRLESVAYVELTLNMVKKFGIVIEKTETGFAIPGGQKYRAQEASVEGDHSNGAFWLAAGAMGADLMVQNLDPESVQGDKETIRILQDMGAGCDVAEEIHAYAGDMKGITVDCADIPDIVPILSVAATKAAGETHFINAGRLRIKESDRLAAMADVLTKLGATVKEEEDSLHVTCSSMKGGCEVDGYNDHRIVMSAAIAALSCEEPVVIRGAQAITKSYPDFFDAFRALGGRADVI